MAKGIIPDNNLWQSTAKERFESSQLQADLSADLVIIGGGYTGCSAALQAAKSGMSVVLLEAETIGYGGSGRNVGLVNAGLWMPPDKVETVLGTQAGSKLNATLAAAPDLVFSLIEKYNIQCEAQRSGTLHCAHSLRAIKDLENRYRQQIERSAPVQLLDKTQTAERTGASTFHASLFDPRAGTIQPLAYCRGLARAAKTAGADIYQQSQVRQIKYADRRWVVNTAMGKVTASAMLVATNAYHAEIIGHQKAAFTPVNFFQLATRPLAKPVVQSILTQGEGCWDTAPVMSSFRVDESGRLILGALGSLGHAASAIHAHWARRKLRALFPALAQTPFEHSWHGRIAMTGDHIPKIINLGKDGYCVFGYSGRGIGPGTVFGKAVIDCLLNSDQAKLPVVAEPQRGHIIPRMQINWHEVALTSAHFVQNR